MATPRISGRKTIGTSAVKLYTGQLKAVEGILIKTDSSNTGTVYISDRSDVTADADDTTDGFPLAASESVVFPVRNPNELWIIGSAAGQKIWWVIV